MEFFKLYVYIGLLMIVIFVLAMLDSMYSPYLNLRFVPHCVQHSAFWSRYRFGIPNLFPTRGEKICLQISGFKSTEDDLILVILRHTGILLNDTLPKKPDFVSSGDLNRRTGLFKLVGLRRSQLLSVDSRKEDNH